jgi:predicted adenine nucleotide alpha hydrolase (AANH) superfamily ATPase
MPTVLKSWSLNLLEPSGPAKACNRIAFKSINILSSYGQLFSYIAEFSTVYRQNYIGCIYKWLKLSVHERPTNALIIFKV